MINHSIIKRLGISLLPILLLGSVGPAAAENPCDTSPYRLNHGENAKHVPIVQAPSEVRAGEPFEVHIRVGEKLHPSLVDHHVEWIQLYADEMLVAHVQLVPTVSLPEITLTVVLDHSADLKAIEAPNHSAGWVSQPVHVRVRR